MTDLLQRRTISFIVRVWAEYQAQDPPACYVEVECLNNGEKRHFRHWHEIARFVERQTTMVVNGEQGVTGHDK